MRKKVEDAGGGLLVEEEEDGNTNSKISFFRARKKVFKKDDVMEVGGRVMKGEGKEKG